MKLYTKRELLEIAYRPLSKNVPDRIIKRCIDEFENISDARFIKIIRRSTNLNIKIFAPGKFKIVY